MPLIKVQLYNRFKNATDGQRKGNSSEGLWSHGSSSVKEEKPGLQWAIISLGLGRGSRTYSTPSELAHLTEEDKNLRSPWLWTTFLFPAPCSLQYKLIQQAPAQEGDSTTDGKFFNAAFTASTPSSSENIITSLQPEPLARRCSRPSTVILPQILGSEINKGYTIQGRGTLYTQAMDAADA